MDERELAHLSKGFLHTVIRTPTSMPCFPRVVQLMTVTFVVDSQVASAMLPTYSSSADAVLVLVHTHYYLKLSTLQQLRGLARSFSLPLRSRQHILNVLAKSLLSVSLCRAYNTALL